MKLKRFVPELFWGLVEFGQFILLTTLHAFWVSLVLTLVLWWVSGCIRLPSDGSTYGD